MKPFLQLTAEDLYHQFGEQLPQVAVVFPNNRARLFFSEHLYKAAGKPLWSPAFITISELFDSQSSLKVADSLSLVQVLYEVYLKVSKKEETFDEFYLWGEILLSDFDDVDKNLADAVQLFRNIREQGEYVDGLEHLSEEQVDAIRMFFKNFDPDRKTELKRRFLENWNILLEVYSQLTDLLRQKGLAYEGLQHRNVVEAIKQDGCSGFQYEHYAFVGFNVLNACEIGLFDGLKKAGKALFYWDYDQYYLSNSRHEAGRFMRQNLERFPNRLPRTEFNLFETTPKDIRFLTTSTENAGARYIPEWLKHLKQSGHFKPEETAVVLCNEGVLLPVLHSIPDDIAELNVTMGFPLQQTPVCTLVNQIAALHTDGFIEGKSPRFNHRYVLPILQHPLVRLASEKADELEQRLRKANSFRPTALELQADTLLQCIFSPAPTPLALTNCLLGTYSELAGLLKLHEESDKYDPLHAEALFRCHNLTSRLSDMLQQQMQGLSPQTFRKLLQQILSRATVPFSGEPVRGLQIMGLLETRNLDFKNVLMLSVNEGMLPKGSNDVSFIPYNLRKAYGLTTMEHKDSIFAYYFFRLLQRAEHISLVYNTATEGLNRGEMSRFMLQLEMESKHSIGHYNLTSGIELTPIRNLQIDKTPEILSALHQQFDRNSNPTARPLSPTALNCLLDCSLRFYFQYIAKLRTPDEITDDVDGAMLGNFFHHSAEYIYTSLLMRKAGEPTDQASVLEAIQKNNHVGSIHESDLEPWTKGIYSIEMVVDLFFKIDFFKLAPTDALPEYNGEQLVRRNLVVRFLKTMLLRDKAATPFDIVGMETHVEGSLVESPQYTVFLGGNVDRMDSKEGVVHLIDYKTGGKSKNPDNIEELFLPKKNRANHIFQLFTYADILQRQQPDTTFKPHLLYIHLAGKSDYNSEIILGKKQNKKVVNDFRPYQETFHELLCSLISNLFNPNIPFVQTVLSENCTFCDYKNLCRRIEVQKNR